MMMVVMILMMMILVTSHSSLECGGVDSRRVSAAHHLPLSNLQPTRYS